MWHFKTNTDPVAAGTLCVCVYREAYTSHIQIHIQIQYIYKHSRTVLLQVRTRLLIPDFGPWRHEERDTTLTLLTPPLRAAHLVVFKISVGRDLKNLTTSFNGRRSNSLLNGPISLTKYKLSVCQNPQNLRTISSGHDVIHTLAPLPVCGFIMTNGDSHILCART